ncbi:MAG: YraN family protein [Desulfobacterales bacterium]|jgi:putative endonuclease|nr:YraN family protein [Desulfobacterales bacterium]
MTFKKKELGAKGEEVAVSYLKSRGYRIVERNYRIRFGEIDIIAEQGDDLVFIEVKTRSGTLFGSPFESVTKQKQKQLSKVALEYISKQGFHDRPARFDVVGIELQKGSETFQDAAVELLQNAFDLCYGN